MLVSLKSREFMRIGAQVSRAGRRISLIGFLALVPKPGRAAVHWSLDNRTWWERVVSGAYRGEHLIIVGRSGGPVRSDSASAD